MIKKITQNIIPLSIIIALIIIVGTVVYTKPAIYKQLASLTAKSLTSKEVGDKAINYINQNILKGQATASLVNAAEENGLYKLTIKVADQEITTYATKDGKFLFPQVIDLTSSPASSEQPSSSSQEPSQQQKEVPATDKPNVKLFVMAFCPYGNQAEETMMPVVNLLADKFGIEPHYVIYSNYGGGGPEYCADKDNKYCSMHGIQELHQNVRELCVWKYQKDKYWDFLKEVNKNCTSQNADTCWEGVATNLGLDTQKIKDCQTNETLSLLEQESALNKKYGITGSPQLLINDVEYSGERTSEAYKNAICAAFKTKPDECKQTLSNATSQTGGGGCQ